MMQTLELLGLADAIEKDASAVAQLTLQGVKGLKELASLFKKSPQIVKAVTKAPQAVPAEVAKVIAKTKEAVPAGKKVISDIGRLPNGYRLATPGLHSPLENAPVLPSSMFDRSFSPELREALEDMRWNAWPKQASMLKKHASSVVSGVVGSSLIDPKFLPKTPRTKQQSPDQLVDGLKDKLHAAAQAILRKFKGNDTESIADANLEKKSSAVLKWLAGQSLKLGKSKLGEKLLLNRLTGSAASKLLKGADKLMPYEAGLKSAIDYLPTAASHVKDSLEPLKKTFLDELKNIKLQGELGKLNATPKPATNTFTDYLKKLNIDEKLKQILPW